MARRRSVSTTEEEPSPDMVNKRLGSISVPLEIHRRVYNQERFDEQFAWQPRAPAGERWLGHVRRRVHCHGRALLNGLLALLPCVTWLPKYQWRKDLSGDAIAGFTVGVMHIPQGMAYASLASVGPVYGLYTSFFSTIVYMLFGTSRQVSMGGFAVISLMVGEVRYRLLPDSAVIAANATGNTTLLDVLANADVADIDPRLIGVQPIQLVGTLSLAVGIILILMGLFRFGFIAAYLSDQVVGGFTTGAAVHVFTSQIGKVFGIKLKRHHGAGALIKIYRDLITDLGSCNWATMIVSLITLVILHIGKEYINPKFKARYKVPIPWELIVVVLGTVVSYFAQLSSNFDITVVGEIPTGLPLPKVPRLDLLPLVASDAFVLAFVVFAVSVSLAKLFSKKYRYVIDPAQEFYAYGLVNIVDAFFSGHTACASLTRSQVNSDAGSRTQLNGVFVLGLLFVTLMWLAPLFEQLPTCVLAAIILLAVKGMFRQFKQLAALWPVWKVDLVIWLVSFVSTVVLNVREGLAVSIVFALFTSIVRSQWPPAGLIVRFQNTDIYYNHGRYLKAEHEPGVFVFRFESPLMFTNSELFTRKFYEKCGIDVKRARDAIRQEELDKESVHEEFVGRARSETVEQKNTTCDAESTRSLALTDMGSYAAAVSAQQQQQPTPMYQLQPVKTLGILDPALPRKLLAARLPPAGCGLPDLVILDLSGFNYIDYMGMETLGAIYDELYDIGVVLLYACAKGLVRDQLDECNFNARVPKSRFFPTVHDAVTYGMFHRQLSSDYAIVPTIRDPYRNTGLVRQVLCDHDHHILRSANVTSVDDYAQAPDTGRTAVNDDEDEDGHMLLSDRHSHNTHDDDVFH